MTRDEKEVIIEERKDLDTINLYASYLIFQQRPADALRALSLEGTDFQPNGEHKMAKDTSFVLWLIQNLLF